MWKNNNHLLRENKNIENGDRNRNAKVGERGAEFFWLIGLYASKKFPSSTNRLAYRKEGLVYLSCAVYWFNDEFVQSGSGWLCFSSHHVAHLNCVQSFCFLLQHLSSQVRMAVQQLTSSDSICSCVSAILKHFLLSSSEFRPPCLLSSLLASCLWEQTSERQQQHQQASNWRQQIIKQETLLIR